MAPMEGGGVLEILSSIVKQPTEGWKSLFKGELFFCRVKLLHSRLIFFFGRH